MSEITFKRFSSWWNGWKTEYAKRFSSMCTFCLESHLKTSVVLWSDGMYIVFPVRE